MKQTEIEESHKGKAHQIKTYTFDSLIGENTRFREVLNIARKAGKSDASVFIYGETGTGKELFAQSIHYASDRGEKPFLAQNCAALPEHLLEGILFGTTKGGFTGAVDRAGLFEQANGGTLLLDEISAMPYELQSKLLRVLQEDYIRRVGGSKDIPVDVRIIATVNEPEEQLIKEGKLRKDLYYRINIVNIKIPPLRERKDDIPLLVEKFLEKHNERFSKQIWMVSEEGMRKLKSYDYPGNVRELENIIMSAVSLADREHVLTEKYIQLLEEDVEDNGYLMGIINHEGEGQMLIGAKAQGLEEYLHVVEKAILEEALKETGGNISRAANNLGISRQNLQHRIKRRQVVL